MRACDRVVGLALLALLIVLTSVAPPARGQTSSPSRPEDPALSGIRSELDRMREELAAMRGELRSLRELLQRLATPPQAAARGPVTVAIGESPSLGRRDAPVTIVEFSDYQCPFCRQFVSTTLPALKSAYVESGKVRYVFRDFPIDQLHPEARKASEAARCAGDQGKYWEMHDVLFQNQQTLAPERLPEHARRLGLDAGAFAACLSSSKYASAVQQSYADGMAAGVRGTPSFVIGRTRPDDRVEGVLVTGARPLADFRQEIDRLLSEK
jgi:protein-disulfide isomerase